MQFLILEFEHGKTTNNFQFENENEIIWARVNHCTPTQHPLNDCYV
jgi:hypothetical protein